MPERWRCGACVSVCKMREVSWHTPLGRATRNICTGDRCLLPVIFFVDAVEEHWKTLAVVLIRLCLILCIKFFARFSIHAFFSEHSCATFDIL